MYREFYGLREMPFNITPDPRFLFLSPTHQEALQHLRYGIEEKKGFIVLTGEVGCGKTTICRALLNELDPARFDTALVLNPRLNETQLVRAILAELGEPAPSLEADELMHRLNAALLSRIHAGRDIVVVIDESQNLTFETLEHLRLISNLETDQQKLLQIVLIGQPELREKLERRELRQLRQRILVWYDLRPLNLLETVTYIQHRLTLCGGSGRPRFTRRAAQRIHRQSGGTPRIINNLCDKAVLSAYVRNADEVTWWDVHRAARELRLS